MAVEDQLRQPLLGVVLGVFVQWLLPLKGITDCLTLQEQGHVHYRLEGAFQAWGESGFPILRRRQRSGDPAGPLTPGLGVVHTHARTPVPHT